MMIGSHMKPKLIQVGDFLVDPNETLAKLERRIRRQNWVHSHDCLNLRNLRECRRMYLRLGQTENADQKDKEIKEIIKRRRRRLYLIRKSDRVPCWIHPELMQRTT